MTVRGGGFDSLRSLNLDTQEAQRDFVALSLFVSKLHAGWF
jgi:hypothetical protein